MSGGEGPIRIFVGCAANSDDLESLAVLDYSIKKHTSLPVDFNIMRLSKDEESPFYSDGESGWQTQLWSTPFSGFRWAVPSLCHFEGRAIYMDSDIIVRADIAELWRQDMTGKVCLAKGGVDSWRFCVTLWDCGAAGALKNLLSVARSRTGHRQLQTFFRSALVTGSFEGEWNCIDGERHLYARAPEIKALHYSSEAHQPHLKYALPRLEALGEEHWFTATGGKPKPHWRSDVQLLFDETLAEALAAGAELDDYAPEKPFGPYNIQNHAGYHSHRWAPRGV